MKKLLTATAWTALAGIVLWWAWLRSPSQEHGEEEQHHDSEVPVRTGMVSKATLRAYVTAYGVVEPEPPGDRRASNSKLAPPAPGVVTEVLCADGDRVPAGQVLFQLDSRAADATLARASNAVGFAEKNLSRQKRLLESGGTSIRLQQEAEQAASAAHGDLAAAEIQRDLLTIKAPFAGTITRITARPGQAVDLTSQLGELIDTDHLVATVAVPVAELALAHVQKGQEAEILADGASMTITNATVSYIGPETDPKTSATTVRIRFENGAGLRPGQPVTARIVTATRADCLTAPESAVIKDQDGQECIAVVTGDKAKLLPVKTGLRELGRVEVEGKGLSEQTVIVSEGAYGLPAATRVRILKDAAAEPEASTNAPAAKAPQKAD